MANHQFYPTPGDLAYRLWAKFQDKDFSRVLEPSAGDGALIMCMVVSARNCQWKVRGIRP